MDGNGWEWMGMDGNGIITNNWLVVWNINCIFPEILGCFHHPNWRTHIFQRGFSPTTNQITIMDHSLPTWTAPVRFGVFRARPPEKVQDVCRRSLRRSWCRQRGDWRVGKRGNRAWDEGVKIFHGWYSNVQAWARIHDLRVSMVLLWYLNFSGKLAQNVRRCPTF